MARKRVNIELDWDVSEIDLTSTGRLKDFLDYSLTRADLVAEPIEDLQDKLKIIFSFRKNPQGGK